MCHFVDYTTLIIFLHRHQSRKLSSIMTKNKRFDVGVREKPSTLGLHWTLLIFIQAGNALSAVEAPHFLLAIQWLFRSQFPKHNSEWIHNLSSTYTTFSSLKKHRLWMDWIYETYQINIMFIKTISAHAPHQKTLVVIQ